LKNKLKTTAENTSKRERPEKQRARPFNGASRKNRKETGCCRQIFEKHLPETGKKSDQLRKSLGEPRPLNARVMLGLKKVKIAEPI
jgi:hypothetical protein